MRRSIFSVLQLGLGVGLLAYWLDRNPSAITEISGAHFGFISAALGCMIAAIGLQLLRTNRLLRIRRWRTLLRTVLVAYSANVLAPAMAGDLYEIAAVSKATHLPARTVLVRLIHRLATTVAALGFFIGVAMCAVHPTLGVIIIAVAIGMPFVVDMSSPLISRVVAIPGTQKIDPLAPIGFWETGIHIDLAIVQHGLAAAAVFFLGAAIDQPVSPLVAGAMLAVADAVTYLPIPLGGVGVHHWTVAATASVLGANTAALVTFNHAIIVVFAGLLGIIGLRISPALRA